MEEIVAALEDEEFVQKVVENVLSNVSKVYNDLNTIFDDVNQTLYAKAGRDTADLIKFVFFL